MTMMIEDREFYFSENMPGGRQRMICDKYIDGGWFAGRSEIMLIANMDLQTAKDQARSDAVKQSKPQ